MSNQEDVISIASQQLGKKAGDYSEFVNITEIRPDFLVPIPRYLNRTDIGIDKASNLPFVGYDTWHGYEVSALTNNGYPVSGMVKLVYPCDSDNIIESKSMKLFWNSFNMVKLGDTVDAVIQQIEEIGSKHLSSYTGQNVSVKFLRYSPGKNQIKPYNWMEEYAYIEGIVDVTKIPFNTYNDDPSVLRTYIPPRPEIIKLTTNVLRSNCRVTHQPDFGDIFFHIEGNKLVEPDSLLQYIVSMRKESHFHEEIVERVYTVLNNLLAPEYIMVATLYTRRGGWDICPVRANIESLIPDWLINEQCYDIKTMRQ